MIVYLFSWEFRSEEHDIKFGILKNENNGKQTEVVPIHRVAAHQMDEIGIFTCEIPGTCNCLELFFFLCLILNDHVFRFGGF